MILAMSFVTGSMAEIQTFLANGDSRRRVRTELSLAAARTQTSYRPIFGAPTAAPGPMFGGRVSHRQAAQALGMDATTRFLSVHDSPRLLVHRLGEHDITDPH